MSISEGLMLLALLPVPLLGGAVLGYLDRAWWWAAATTIVLFNVAAIAPAPEAGLSHPLQVWRRIGWKERGQFTEELSEPAGETSSGSQASESPGV